MEEPSQSSPLTTSCKWGWLCDHSPSSLQPLCANSVHYLSRAGSSLIWNLVWACLMGSAILHSTQSQKFHQILSIAKRNPTWPTQRNNNNKHTRTSAQGAITMESNASFARHNVILAKFAHLYEIFSIVQIVPKSPTFASTRWVKSLH